MCDRATPPRGRRSPSSYSHARLRRRRRAVRTLGARGPAALPEVVPAAALGARWPCPDPLGSGVALARSAALEARGREPARGRARRRRSPGGARTGGLERGARTPLPRARERRGLRHHAPHGGRARATRALGVGRESPRLRGGARPGCAALPFRLQRGSRGRARRQPGRSPRARAPRARLLAQRQRPAPDGRGAARTVVRCSTGAALLLYPSGSSGSERPRMLTSSLPAASTRPARRASSTSPSPSYSVLFRS